MSGKADCFKILPRKNRATKAWNPHSASIMQRAKSWEVLPCAWHDYVRVGLHGRYFCIGCIDAKELCKSMPLS